MDPTGNANLTTPGDGGGTNAASPTQNLHGEAFPAATVDVTSQGPAPTAPAVHQTAGRGLDLGEPDAARLAEALGRAGAAGEERVVPVIREDVVIETRPVETGRVRVVKTVREEQQVVDKPVRREEVTVERVALNRFITPDQVPPTRTEGDTTIIPVVEEVLVVERRLMLKEEVRIRKRRVELSEPHTVTLRREEVNVEHLPGRQDEA